MSQKLTQRLAGKAKALLLLMALGANAPALAETLSLVTYYGKTGGIVGDLNKITDKVNGISICPSANTNVNSIPGCDFSDDPGYEKNSVNDPTDDTYSGDLIVRNNDQFEVFAGWSMTNGNEPVTLTAVLPDNTLRWGELPSSCKAGSSISTDGLTLVCVRSDYSTATAYSEDLPMNVVVKGGAPNGHKPGDITITASSANAAQKSDAAGRSIITTATPRWNLQKSAYTYSYGQNFNGKTGTIIEYKYYLEVDEVSGATDTASGVLGNASLGTDFTLEFDDDLSSVAPHAQLVECRKDRANSTDPFSYYRADQPEKSVATPLGTMVQTCVQAAPGGEIHVKHEHIDASLSHIPTVTSYYNNPIPVTRAIAAIGVIRVFIPDDDIAAGINATDTATTDELRTKNILKNFDPNSADGQSNFGADVESDKDNTYARTLYGTAGSFSKHYTTNLARWWESAAGGGTGYRAGDGVVTPEAKWTSRVNYYNQGSRPLTGGIVCDIFDANKVDVTDNPASPGHATKVFYNSGHSDADVAPIYEYATGYVSGSWPPDPNADPRDRVAQECGDASVQWHSTTTAARAVGPITKIRVRFPNGLPPGTNTYSIINLTARSNDLAGNPLPSGTIIPNYASVTDDNYYNTAKYPATNGWYPSSYQPKSDYSIPHAGSGGDRIMLVRARVRVLKNIAQSNVTTGDMLDVSLTPSFTCDGTSVETSNVKVIEMLDKGLNYVAGTSSAPLGEPVIGSCADLEDGTLKTSCTANHTVLVWDLGTKTCNTTLPEISYDAQVAPDAPTGTLHTYSTISSPTDTSNVGVRTANQNVNVAIPTALVVTKTTPDQYFDKGDGVQYTVHSRNGTQTSLTALDMIDILPFNGDGTTGYKFTVGSNITSQTRNPASDFEGTIDFVSASPSASCIGTLTYSYTNRTPSDIDISPTATTNKSGGATTWCVGTPTGPAANCGFNNAAVTALRVTGANLAPSSICSITITQQPGAYAITYLQRYANTAGAFAQGVSLPTISNVVSVVAEPPATVDDTKSNPDPIAAGNPTTLDIVANDFHNTPSVGINKATVNFDPASVTGGVGTDTDNDGDIDQVVVAGEGTWTVDNTGKVTFTPEAGYKKDPTPLQYSIKGNNGFISPKATITIDYPQTAPAAADDSKAGFTPGDTGSLNVLTNDTDPENDLDPTTVKFTGSVATGATITPDGKTMTVPNEGVWTVTDDGTVTFTPEAGFTADPSPIRYTVADVTGQVSNEATVTLDYDPLRKISGHVGIDLTGDNSAEKDPLEPVTITLYAADGTTVVATTTTDSFGNYSFDVPGGNYIVKETDPSGTTSVWDKDGTDDNTIAVDASTGDVPANDFVERPLLGALEGTTFSDGNKDGTHNGSEVVIANIDIIVTDAYGKEYTVVTDANGDYSIPNLPAGPARVVVKSDDPDIPEGAEVTGAIPSTPATVIIPPNATAVHNIGYFVPVLTNIDPADVAECANPSSITWEGATVSSKSIWSNMLTPASKTFTTVGDRQVGVTMSLDDTSGQFNLVNGSGTNAGIFNGPYLTLYLGKQTNPSDTDGYQLHAGDSATLTVTFDEEVLLDNWRIRDIDAGNLRGGVAGWDWQDAVQMTALDANGNAVPLDTKFSGTTNLIKDAQGFIHTGNAADLTGGGTDSIMPRGHIVYSSSGLAIKTLKLVHKAGPDVANQTRSAIALSGFAVCTPLRIAGTVKNDGDGNANGVTGTAIETADGSALFVHLVDSTGTVVDSVKIGTDGTYLFDKNIQINTDYTVVLSKDQTAAGSSMPAPVLPVDWVNVSEDVATDAALDGVIPVSVASASKLNVDFGINKKPTAGDVVAPVQVNPGADTKVQVVDLVVADMEDTKPTTVVIESLPVDGTLYYNNVPVDVGQTIPNFDPTKLTVDPKKGNVSVIFDYHTVDAAGVASDGAKVTMPFNFIVPTASDDTQSNPVSASDTVVDILANDNQGADKGSYPLDPQTVKFVAANGDEVATLTVAGEGVWTVDPATGKATFNPDQNFTKDPTPVNYTVEDTEGNKVSAKITIDYPQSNPVAVDDSKSGGRGEAVEVDVIANDTDPESDIDPASVKLIDATGAEVTELVVPNEGKWTVDPVTGRITFTPNADFLEDPAPVEYTVKDYSGLVSNKAKVTVDYPQTTPVAINDERLDQPSGTSVTISVIENDEDPENDIDPSTVRLIDAAGNPVTSLVVAGEGIWVVDLVNGKVTFTPESGFTKDPSIVEYQVKDDTNLLSNKATIKIDYRQTTPQAVDDTKINPDPSTPSNPTTVEIVGNDIDPENDLDPSTVRLIDKNGNEVTTLTAANEGVWTVNTTTGDITFTPDAGFTSDPLPVKYTVKDRSDLVSNQATVTVDYPQTGTVAENDTKINPDPATPSNPTTLPVVANDHDPENDLDPTQVKLVDGINAVTTLTVAGEGVWTVNTTSGDITFTPEAGFTNDPSPVKYTITDKTGLISNQAIVTVDYPQTKPVAVDDTKSNPVTASPTNPTTVKTIDNDTDPENDLDPKSVKLVDSTGNPVTTLDVAGEGIWTVDADTGDITFTPTAGFTGDPTPVKYTVKDTTDLESNQATVTVDYPQTKTNAVDDKKSNPNTASPTNPTTVQTVANDTDPENDLDPTTVKMIDPAGNPVTTLTVAGEGEWVVDPVSGDITFTPETGFTGDPTPIKYTVKDATGLQSDPATVTVDYPQTSPVAGDDTKANQKFGTAVTLNVLDNDTDPENDLDPTTVKLIDPNGNPVTTLTVAGEGVWTVDPVTGAITFTPQAGFVGDPTPVKYTVADKTGMVSNQATVSIDYEDPAALVGTVWLDQDKNGNIDANEPRMANWTLKVRDKNGKVVAEVKTNERGEYAINDLIPAEYTVEFYNENGTMIASQETGLLSPQTPGSHPVNISVPIDPSGVMYDSVSREPIKGVTLELLNSQGNPVDPACVGAGQQPQTTTALGNYAFDVNANAVVNGPNSCGSPETYTIHIVSVPGDYFDSSAQIKPEPGVFTSAPTVAGCTVDAIPGNNSCEVQAQGVPPTGNQPTTYFMQFTLTDGDRDVIFNHIALDPKGAGSVLVSKKVDKRQASIGDMLYYSIDVANIKALALQAINVVDDLPAGFNMAQGSARLIRAGTDGKLGTKDDVKTVVTPTGTDPMTFNNIALAGNETVRITYLMKIGASVIEGNHVNTARALYNGGRPASNTAKATVLIVADAVIDQSTLIGKVFHDRDGDGYQDSANATGITIKGANGFVKHLGGLTGRISQQDAISKHRKSIMMPLSRDNSFTMTSQQGAHIYVDHAGQISESHTGMKAKGITGQDLQVEFHKAGGNMQITVTNYGIHEEGIPGVRLATVTGLLIETDGHGRFHIPDVDGGRRGFGKNFILKVDKATLPKGSVFTTENPRVLRLTGAALNKINFGVKLPNQAAPSRHVRQSAQYRTEQRSHTVTSQQPNYQSVAVNLGSIFFDKDKYNIRKDQRGIMDDIASKIERYGSGHITIDAFTDARHNAAYNIKLAERRANTVRAELHKRLGSKLMRNVKVEVDPKAYKQIPHNDPKAVDYDESILDGLFGE